MEDKFSWKAPEYEFTEKPRDWYWLVSIIAAGAAVVSAASGNFLFTVFIVLSAFTIMLYGSRKPRIASFEISGRGVRIGKRLYPYSNLNSFWIFYDPPRKKELSLESKKTLMPRLALPLGNTDPNIARQHIIKYLPEKEQEESLIENLSQYLGL